MTTRLFGVATLAASMLSFGQQTGTAAPEHYDGEVIMGASLSDTVCNAGNAARLPLDQALRSAGATGDQCFAIDGFWHADALFATLADARVTWSNAEPALAGRRLGVYGSKRLMAAAPHGARRYTLVGRLRHCDTAWPGATMVLGYCHHGGGPFLIIAQVIALGR